MVNCKGIDEAVLAVCSCYLCCPLGTRNTYKSVRMAGHPGQILNRNLSLIRVYDAHLCVINSGRGFGKCVEVRGACVGL